MKENYRLMMERTIAELRKRDEHPRLLLHSCCAPCSSAVLEQLTEDFDITLYYYNPNISPEAEYLLRVRELEKFVAAFPAKRSIEIAVGPYEPERFYAMAKGLERVPEGGERCTGCYRMRLEKTAEVAREGGFDFFTTTLSISPLKDAQRLNDIGREYAEQVGVPYLCSDFKKKDGYRRSCALSKEYGLYRQDYCGCIYSKMERDERLSPEQLNNG
ncbi:MAG: epoxyqueuosine reductase QueH [Clostridia bacterium]|nr:epoxyqueuosine reductase QueH [Clostridia bacterium]